MRRFALVALLVCAASAARAADLPAGTWAANVDGEKGNLVVKEVKKDGTFTGVLLGTDVTGTWDGKTLTFKSGKDTYEAHLVAEPAEKGLTKYTLTGTRSQQVFIQNRAGTGGGAVHVAKVGWYAQTTAETPAQRGAIKAEVRGVLKVGKGSAYVAVKRDVAGAMEETRVWVGSDDWKAAERVLAALDGKEVIVTGNLFQSNVRNLANPLDSGLSITGKFEISPADTPK